MTNNDPLDFSIDLPTTINTKVSFRCLHPEDKEKLRGSSAIIHISIGQSYHEGKKFLATMDLINETFSSCTIMLCDSLQRHTLRIKDTSLTEQQAYDKSMQESDQWLERNRMAWSMLDIKSELIRWDSWLQHPDYQTYRDQIDELYRDNLAFRECVRATIQSFLERQDLINNKQAFESCKAYILEECPVLIPLWADLGTNFVIYPRFRTPAMRETHKHFVGKDAFLLREVALKFNHRTVPKKLSFSRLMTTELLDAVY